MDVMLSMNRSVATSVSLAVMSRPTETRCFPSCEKTVSRTQSSWAPWNSTCVPVSASIARSELSAQPKAISLPSGDQLPPYTVSNVTGTDSSSFFRSTLQTCTSPIRAGRPPVTASRFPSGENRTDSIRSDIPTSRAARPVPSALCSRTSWKPATASKVPVGRVVQRGDDRRTRIDRRMLLVVSLPGIGRGVVLRALGDPAADQFDVAGGQRGLALRHLRLAVLGRDQLDQPALVGLARHDRRLAAFAGGHAAVRTWSSHSRLPPWPADDSPGSGPETRAAPGGSS